MAQRRASVLHADPTSNEVVTELEEDRHPVSGDGDWFVAVDTLYESVWVFESAGEELGGLTLISPSLAVFFDELLALLICDNVHLGTGSEREARRFDTLTTHSMVKASRETERRPGGAGCSQHRDDLPRRA
jgi:hypothetical protein